MTQAMVLGAALLASAFAIGAKADPAVSVNDAAVGGGMPRTLSEFAFFADAAAQVPAGNVISYRLNTPLYSDGAEKLRFVYLPEGTQARFDGEGLMQLPIGAALIKTFAFEEDGKRRLIETRVLLHRDDGWVALPYLWNDAQTEATLAIAGARVGVTTPKGEKISYRVPNKNQCKECHGLDGAVVPIGPKARNLSAEWLQQLTDGGHLDKVGDGADVFPVWERRDGSDAQSAARAYLDINCAHCHRPGATASNSGLDLRWEQHDPQLLGIGKRPVAAGRGAGGLLYDVVPGRPAESILLYRMKVLDGGVAMPELGKSTVDEDGVAVIRNWIEGMD